MQPVILTVTLNFALDLTYQVDEITLGTTMRPRTLGRQAGGKGVNVGRVLHALGHEVAVTGFAGGANGESARSELRTAGIRDETVSIAAESRLAMIVVDAAGVATGFSERGPEISPGDWESLRGRVEALAGEASVVVLAGNVPPGAPPDGYRQLVEAAHAAGTPALLDADSDWLRLALPARPDLVKINRHELAGVTDASDVVAGAQALREAGAQTVVITDGPEGLILVGEAGIRHAAPPRAVHGNPTGAGDAASAAFAAAMRGGLRSCDSADALAHWGAALADAAALSAAAVAAPLAGHFDAALYRELSGLIVVRDAGY
jgi:tagatose 6-phosphate kinase